MAPDTERKSGQVTVAQDFYMLYPAASYVHTYLFRYSATLGPNLIYGRTKYSYAGDDEAFDYWETGVLLRLGLEYAFNELIELHGTFGWQYRIEEKKEDYMYGLMMAYYL